MKIIRAGDISFLKIYEVFKSTKDKTGFINNIQKLADDKEIGTNVLIVLL